jgi:hypothetical protein
MDVAALRNSSQLLQHHFANELYAAYWIAFGPHGPRAGSPPGEGTKIFTYTVIGVAASLAIFLATHHMANPPPHTLTKEWEEATNEYFKVRRESEIWSYCRCLMLTRLSFCRRTRSNRSPAYHPQATKDQARCRVRLHHSSTIKDNIWITIPTPARS